MKFCTNVWLLMWKVRGAIPIRPKVVQLAVFTQKDILVMSALSDIFWNRWYEMPEHEAPVPNRAMICLLLKNLTANWKVWIWHTLSWISYVLAYKSSHVVIHHCLSHMCHLHVMILISLEDFSNLQNHHLILWSYLSLCH